MPSRTPLATARLRAFAAALLWLSACHLGRPPVGPGGEGVHLGAVRAAVAEAGVADAVRSGLAAGLARRGVPAGGPAVDVDVIEADLSVVGVASGRRVHRARLVLSCSLLGPRPRQVVLRAERSYEASATDGLDAADARARTFDQLADELAGDLAAWLALGPGGPPPPTESP
ncbi:MAG: hypothetical protein H6742_07400 [Alphaproteobacteria bacterium]|nr:hypothetical protein [Alphaproteobacteria bacterium]